jgi:hypothetical protein
VWAESRALFRIGEAPLQIDILLQISGVESYTQYEIRAGLGSLRDHVPRLPGRAFVALINLNAAKSRQGHDAPGNS